MDKKDYTFNPRARLKFTIGTPVKGEGFKIFDYLKLGDEGFKNSVLAFRDTGLWDSLLIAIESPEKIVQLPAEHVEVFVKMGILLPPQNISKPLLFQVPITDTPSPLIPESFERTLPPHLMLNPKVTFQWEQELPTTIQPYVFSQELLSRERPVIWVYHPQTTFCFPYSLSRELAQFLFKQPPPQALANLPTPIRSQLHWANILIDPTQSPTLIDPHELQARLLKQEYLVLRKLLPPLQIAALRHHIRQLKQEGYFFNKEDKQVKLRDYIHNDQLMSFFHIPMARYLNTFLPQAIQPSFTFLCYYNPGAVLDRHTDREQCAWNVSLCTDMQPEYPLEKVWPIYLEANAQEHKILLELGDALIYRGTQNDHWREALPEGDQVSMSLFHFVDFKFDGDLT